MAGERTWKHHLATVFLLVVLSINSVLGTTLSLTVSNGLGELYVDDERINHLPNSGNWFMADHYQFDDDHVRLVAVRGFNVNSGCSGILLHLHNSSLGYNKLSDRQWKCTNLGPERWQYLGFNDAGWSDAHEIGLNGVVAGCSFIPVAGLHNNAIWIWTPNFIDADVVVSCRGYAPVCDYAPCVNGGTCQLNEPALCRCPVHYTGRFCELERNECESNPCQHGGSCELTDVGYQCLCAPGYSGVHCETDTTPCASSPCENGGTCEHDIDEGTYSCTCLPEYTGTNCETLIDYCESAPCQNGGTCQPVPGTVVCTCVPGFTGALCQIQINYCASTPCQNAGTCVPGVNEYNCLCHDGYSGTHCETGLGACAVNPCQHGGTCTLGGPGGSVLCLCPEGYLGQFCEISDDFCESNPCRNGGTCLPNEDGYVCICPPGYNGTVCQSVISNCGHIMAQSSYPPIRNFWALCEINIIDHSDHVMTPCRDLIVGINHYNTSEGILAAGGTFGCYVTRFPDEMANGACINNYNQGTSPSACLSCTHMGVCIKAPPE